MPDLTTLKREEILKAMADSNLADPNFFSKHMAAIVLRSSEVLEGNVVGLSNSIDSLSGSTKSSINDLTASINKNQQSSDILNKRLFILNILLTIATIIAAIATVAQLFNGQG